MGFGSLYVPEHTHIPTSRRTPPPTGDAELAEEYKRTLDPLVALTSAAAATERLMVGHRHLLVAQRDPIVTAKAIATLDLCRAVASCSASASAGTPTSSRTTASR